MKYRVLVLALAVVCAPLAARAQAVPRDAGTTFYSLSQSYFSATHYFDSNGNRQPNGCDFQKDATSLYVEHGFDARDTGSVNVEYDRDSCNGSSTSGLNDIDFAFLHQLHHSATTSFGWKAQLIAPTGYSIDANPRIGYDRFGGQFGFALGGNFRDGDNDGFYSLESGVRAYIGYPAPQLRTFGTVGVNATRQLQIIGQLEWNQALGAGHTLTNVGLNPTIFPSYNDVQAIATLRLRIAPHLSLVGSTTGLLYGRDYGIGSTSAIGIWGDF